MTKKKILIVEDNDKLIKFLSDKLDKEGYDLSVAKNGKLGLQKVATDKPDLILLDLVMPVMDGLTMLKKLRENSKIPVIILSNLSDEDVIKEAGELGSESYMVKVDYSLDDIVAKIEKILK